MKHFFCEALFFLIIFPEICSASIDVTISNLESKEDYYSIDAVVTGMSSSSATFIQGMFTKSETTKYFGFTLCKKGEWLAYESSPEKSFVLDNFIELKNNIVQKIYIKPNYTDLDYLGPGNYILKLKRYTASGSPSDYSNSVELNLSHVLSSPDPTPTPTNLSPSPSSNTVTPPPSTPTKSQVTNSPASKSSVSQIPSNTKVTKNLAPTENTFPQVLATTSSVVSTESSIVIPAEAGIHQIDIAEESTISSGNKLSDKNLFLAGITILSLSSGLLYFRLKNL